MTNCSRIGCRHAPDAHEVSFSETSRCEGNDALELGQPERAVLCYTKAITAAPGDATLWSNRSAAFLALRRYHQALHDAERAAAIEPSWAKARARVGAAHAGMHQYEAAARALAVAVKLEPGNTAYAQALAAARQAAQAASRPRQAPVLDQKAVGDAAARAHRYDEAAAAYTAALRGRPRDAVLLSNRSAAHAGAGRFEAALRDAEAAASASPCWSRAWSRVGFALFAMKRHDEAARAYERALKLDPGASGAAVALDAAQRAAEHGAGEGERMDAAPFESSSPPAPRGSAETDAASTDDTEGCCDGRGFEDAAAAPDCGQQHDGDDDILAAAAALEAATRASLARTAAAQAAARVRVVALRWQALRHKAACAQAMQRRVACVSTMAEELRAARSEAASLRAEVAALSRQCDLLRQLSVGDAHAAQPEACASHNSAAQGEASKETEAAASRRVTMTGLVEQLGTGSAQRGEAVADIAVNRPGDDPSARCIDSDSDGSLDCVSSSEGANGAESDADGLDDEELAAWAARWEAEQFEAARGSAMGSVDRGNTTPHSRRRERNDADATARASLPVDALRRLFTAGGGGGGACGDTDGLMCDANGCARGACTSATCAAPHCAAFSPFSPGGQLSAILPPSAHLALLSSAPRTRCAACGCTSAVHETREKAATRKRIEVEKARRAAAQVNTAQMQRKRCVRCSSFNTSCLRLTLCMQARGRGVAACRRQRRRRVARL